MKSIRQEGGAVQLPRNNCRYCRPPAVTAGAPRRTRPASGLMYVRYAATEASTLMQALPTKHASGSLKARTESTVAVVMEILTLVSQTEVRLLLSL